MMAMESKLTKQDLEYIGEYLTETYPQVFRLERIKFNESDFHQRERIIRVEEELKNQRELMKQGFELMEKRFEQMERHFEKRFELVDKQFDRIETRFKMVFSFMFLGFTTLAFMMTAFKFFY